MKRTIVLSILVAGLAANAQTSSTKSKTSKKATVAQTQTQSSALKTQPVPAQQTTTAATTTVAPAAAKKWSGLINVMPYATESNLSKDGASAAYATDYVVGVGYKLTDKMKAEVLGAMTYNKSNGGKDSITDMDPQVKLGYKTDARLLGSEAIGFSGRYYVPVSTGSINKSNGTLRFNTAVEWVLDPKWTFGTSFGTRLYLHTNHSRYGSNGELRLEPDVSLTYNLTDKLSGYVSTGLYLRSTDYLRGEANVNGANYNLSYLGLNYGVGFLTINPMVEIGRDLKDGQARSEDTSYILNLVAVF